MCHNPWNISLQKIENFEFSSDKGPYRAKKIFFSKKYAQI